MNVQQAELYERIQAFSLDNPDANLPFSKRLVRDNGWSAEYTQRVIDEYKKFTFLAVAAEAAEVNFLVINLLKSIHFHQILGQPPTPTPQEKMALVWDGWESPF